MREFFPVGIQLSAFLFAESTMHFSRLEGKIEQEIVIYLQFSSFCPFIWKNILQEKAYRVHKFQQTHDELLQSYQNRGKRNYCVTIPTKIWGPWNALLYISLPNFPSSLSLSYSFGQETTHKLSQCEHLSNIMKTQIYKLSFALYWPDFYRNACLIWFQTIKPCISVFSNFSHCKQSHAMVVLSGEQTLPPSQRSDPLSPAATQTAALCSSRVLSFQQSGV